VARILVIDDDPAVSTAVSLLLERGGYEAVTAGNGRQGLTTLACEDFDLLIIDIFMPEMDGLETIRLVRQRKPTMPIIVMSGAQHRPGPMPNFLCMATRLGAIESLRKPFNSQILIKTVESCLGRTKMA
jgi:DNA-binding NtrC family response regulator